MLLQASFIVAALCGARDIPHLINHLKRQEPWILAAQCWIIVLGAILLQLHMAD